MILTPIPSHSRILLAWVAALWILLSAPALSGAQPQEPARPVLVPSPRQDEESMTQLYPKWWGSPPRSLERIPCREPGKCVTCHEDHARMDPSHALACVQCHHGNPGADEENEAHKGLVADPGDLTTVKKTCGRCHPEEVRRVKSSAMALAPRMINHTRFAFGAQKDPAPHYATVKAGKLKQVPDPSQSKNLGDDLLRRSCLRCHLYTRGSTRWGEHRGEGCSACHVAYPNGSDAKAANHEIVRNTGITACLKCHNSNHVGADYVGLYEKDFQRGFLSPFVEGRQPPRIYGAEHHRLAADIHFRAGMECMDCHSLDEVHGTGELPNAPNNAVRISCEGCHVRGDHPAVLKEPSGKMLLIRGPGRTIPAWDPEIIPHRVAAHRKKLRCSACHAAWSFQDYGFHLMLEERADYWKWAPTAGQNDPQVQELLARYVGTYADPLPPQKGALPYKPMSEWKLPVTKDWLSGEERPGAWFRGYTVRRWELPPLGLDSEGRISIMRPIYQYVISHVDAEDNLLADRKIPTSGSGRPALIFNPYVPHTTSRIGRSCHECHGSPKAAGLGQGLIAIGKPGFSPVWMPESQIPGHSFRWDALVDAKGNALQWSSHPSAGPLDPGTVDRLLHPSPRHRAEWYQYLNAHGRRP